MAEVVGLIASTMTIAAVVIEGVRVVKSCYRASNELEILQVSDSLGAVLSLFHQIGWEKVANVSRVKLSNFHFW